MNAKERQAAAECTADPQTKTPDLDSESACMLLSSIRTTGCNYNTGAGSVSQ